MKTIKLLILTSIYLFVINIYETNGLETNVLSQDSQAASQTADTANILPIIDDKKDDSNKIQFKDDPGIPQVAHRILKRKRKGRKTQKRKNKRRNKKSRKNRKGRNRKNRGSYDLVPDVPLESEIPEVVDDLVADPQVEPILPPDLEDESSLLESNLITPLEEVPVIEPVGAGALNEFSKNYWDSEMVEPEYVISEWFAILDGKKFNKSSGTKFPYISQHEHDQSVSYLSNKTQHSKHLMNKYSSGAKYMNNDDDNSDDYIKRVRISFEDLQATNGDISGYEFENSPVNQNVAQNVGNNYMPVRRNMGGRRVVRRRLNRNTNRRRNRARNRSIRRGRRRAGSGRTGIYDVQKAFETDVPVVPGTYRKFDEDEIERYGLTHNKVVADPVDIIDDAIVDEPILDDVNDIDSLAEDTSYDVSDLSLDSPIDIESPIDIDSPVEIDSPIDSLDSLSGTSEPVGPSITTERLEYNDEGQGELDERIGFDQILSNDYDEVDYRDRPNRRDKKKYKLSNKKCKKELKQIKKKYGELVKQLREQASE